MAEGREEQSRGFPMIPARIWWELRAKAKRSPPPEITASYVATACGISEKAAANVVPHLRRVGLIEKDSNKTTPRLFDWREDESYAKVCADVLKELYPAELRDALPPPDPDRSQAERWFARKTQTGESSSKQMASFYALVAKADVRESEQGEGEGGAPRPRPRPAPREPPAPKRRNETSAPDRNDVRPKTHVPAMHIDIQIHISPQSSPEQIDAIFASMARHLYRSDA